MKIVSLTVENVYWVSQVLSFVLLAGTVVLGGVALFAGKMLNDRQAEEILKLSTKLEEQRQKTEEQREKTAKLEKEATDARLELEKIDPLNAPIRSIRADVWLVVRADFFEWYFKKNDPVLKGGGRAVSVTLAGKEGALVVLHECTDFESMPWAEQGQPDGRTFQMSFAWPVGDWFSAQDVKYWVERNNASTAMLDRELVGAVISLPPAKEEKPAEILQSSCMVTINGSIRRNFSVPKASVAHSIFCPIKHD